MEETHSTSSNSLEEDQNVHWSSVIQLTISLLAAIGLLGLALLLLLQAIKGHPSNDDQALPMLLFAAGLGFSGILLLPSAWFALLRLSGLRPKSTLPRWFPRQATMLISLLIVMPMALLAGNYIIHQTSWAWLLLPPLHILLITIPILWLVHLGCYQLSTGSPQRKWGIFASGLILGPGFATGAEVILGIIVIAIILFILALQPELVDQFIYLVEQIKDDPMISPEQISDDFLPYLQQPFIIYIAGVFVTILVPLIEEAFKPIGLWLLSRKMLSPSEGFAAGVLSGAGFALFESLGYGAANVENWTNMVLARSGTAVMHIVTSGMVGWALCSTWNSGRYKRLVSTYLVAVLIHSLWNGLTISFGLLGQQITGMLESAILFQLVGAGVLGLLLLALLIILNATVQRAIISLPESAPPTTSSYLEEPSSSYEEKQDNGISKFSN